MPRSYCPQCQRPLSACYCHLVVSKETQTQVTILQHPLETNNAKNTARLLHLCLRNSELLQGEKWQTLPLQTGKTPVLLYPPSPEENHSTIKISDIDPINTQLIVLDGTWRKTRKMLHLSSALKELPRLDITFSEPSHYRIRKAPNEASLSTFEAVYHCLKQLETGWDNDRQLLKSFSGFLDLWDALK